MNREELTELVLSGCASAEEWKEYNAFLREHPEEIRNHVEQARLHGLLLWKMNPAMAVPASAPASSHPRWRVWAVAAGLAILFSATFLFVRFSSPSGEGIAPKLVARSVPRREAISPKQGDMSVPREESGPFARNEVAGMPPPVRPIEKRVEENASTPIPMPPRDALASSLPSQNRTDFFTNNKESTMNSATITKTMAAAGTAVTMLGSPAAAGTVITNWTDSSLSVTEDTSLAGAAFPAASVSVSNATLTLTEAASTVAVSLPAALTNGLVFWVDANKNVLTNSSGEVDEWLDAREAEVTGEDDFTNRVANASWGYPRAIVYTNTVKYASVPPTFASDESLFPGKRFVDFGEYQSGKWLLWVGKNGVHQRQIVRAYAAVVGFGASDGFLIGDVSAPSVGGSGYTPYHKGSGGGDGKSDCISSTYGSGVNSHMMYGESRLNGVRVDPTTTAYIRNGYQLFSQNGPYNYRTEIVDPVGSTFMNNSNFKKVDSYNDRQGGGKIGEMLMFNRTLTDDERLQVEAYLNQKWFGKAAAGSFCLASNAVLAISNDFAMTVQDVGGAGTMVKSGTGTVTIAGNAKLFTGSLQMKQGKVQVTQKGVLPPLSLSKELALRQKPIP